ncbi:MAG: hypothetical protein GW948_02250 [Rhodobacterales bacterium]|nr:hypothetical protein [Rhodobacterales bacterium]
MAGLVIKGGNFLGAGSRPFLLDAILTDGPGSLMLIDVRNWASGVPASDAALTNIARVQSNALGLGAANAIFRKVGDLTGGGFGLIERSTKGGLHVAVRQSSGIAANQGYNIEVPESVMAYMIANPTHNYYYSQWRRLTRASLSEGTGAKALMAVENNTTGGFVLMSQTAGQERPTLANRIGRSMLGAGQNVLGNTADMIAGPYTAGTSATPTTEQYASGRARSLAQFGSVLLQNSWSAIAAQLQSWVFYRAYVEDLTLSGRTFAEVSAIDSALWTAAFGTGGVFAGDSHTAPSSTD